jgi:sporulation protein YlmC with PRC-barrel domain
MLTANSNDRNFQKRFTGLVASVAVLCLLLVPGAQAADDRIEASSPKQDKASMEKQHLVPASDLIGSDVKNQNSEKVGEVSDIIIDGNSGQVPYAVVTFGGVLDFGDELFAIPWKAFAHDHEEGACVLNLTMMKDSPNEEEKRDWKEVNEEPQTSGEEESLIGDYWVEASDTDQERPQHRSVALSANRILGAPVQNMSGEEVGALHDMVLDFDRGRISKTVFATGGVLGIGQEKRLLPWKSFSYSREKAKLITDITKEKIESAPVYDEGIYASQRPSSRL